MAVKFEDFMDSLPAGFRYHVEGELLEYSVVALFVGFAKIAPRYLFSDSEMIDLARMGFQSNDEITQALPV